MQPDFEQDDKLVTPAPPEPALLSTAIPFLWASSTDPSWFITRWRRVSAWLQITLFSPGVLPAPWSHPIFGYLFAILGQTLVMTLLLYAFPALRYPSALVLFVVLLTALAWGVGQSIVATLVGGVLLLLLTTLLYPLVELTRAEEITGILLYIVVGLAISLLTSQVQRERRAARALSQRLETIIETLPDPLVLYDPQGRPIMHNKRARESLLSGEEDISLAHMTQLLHLRNANGEVPAVEDLPLARALRGEQIVGAELHYFPLQDQQERVVVVSAAPLRSLVHERIEGAITITHDLTPLRRTEQKVRASEERYRTIVETAREGIWLIDTDARTLYANSHMAELLGYTQEEMMEHSVLEFIYPEDERAARVRIERNLRGYAEQFEFRLRRRDGRVLETLAATSPVRDADGTITGALGLFTDLTARKRIEEALQHSEEILQLALRNSPIAIFQQDRDLRYTWMYNPPSATPEGVVGKMDSDFVSPEEAVHLTALKQRVLDTGEVVHEEVHITSSERPRWQLLTFEPLRDRQGSIIGISGTSINITDRKHLEQERERLVQQAQMRANELEAVFEAMTDAVTVFDEEGRIVQMNQSAKTLTARYLPSTALGEPVTKRYRQIRFFDLDHRSLPEADFPTVRLLRGETLVGDQSQEVVVTTHEGESLLLNVTGAPLRDANGKQVGAVTVTRDLTNLRQLEQRTHRALDALLTMAQVMTQDIERDEEALNSSPLPSRQITQRIAELTRNVLGCERLSLTAIEPGTERLHPLAVSGLDASQEQSWWAEQERYEGYFRLYGTEQVERLSRQEIVLMDLRQPPWNELANPFGVSVLLIAPLFFGARLIGILQLDYGGRDHTYTSQELALTQAASRLIAVILERERLLVEQAQAQLREEELQSANQRLVDLLALAHDAVIMRDPTSRTIFWNRGAERLYGWTEHEALGQITHDLLSTRFATSQELVDAQLAATRRWEGRLTHTRLDGQEVLVESRQVLVRNASGETEAVLEINRDISERERLTQERMQAQANELAAREATNLMEEFLGIVGHELRTPLTTIKASVQLARRSLKRVKQREEALPEDISIVLNTIGGLLERTERQVGMQNRLVSDLLDTSRIQSGRLELHPQALDIVALARQVVDDHRALTPDRAIYDEVSSNRVQLLVLADEDRLRQVIANFLSNALKYSEDDKPVTVRVEADLHNSLVRVAVIDEGPGLSAEQQQHLWERFYRVPGIEIKSGSGVGLGLGLNIARMLIERQGGQVGVDSQPGRGSTFWFTLPLAETEKDGERD